MISNSNNGDVLLTKSQNHLVPEETKLLELPNRNTKEIRLSPSTFEFSQGAIVCTEGDLPEDIKNLP